MGKWIDKYNNGMVELFVGHGISFYAYISIVLAEIFYIWRFLPENAMMFTILLGINCIVIGVFGTLKRLFAFTRGERIVAVIYWIALAFVFAAGCFVNVLQNIVLYFLPIAFSAVWIFLRDIQMMRFATSNSKILVTITLIFCNCLMWPILTAFVSLGPMVILLYILNMIFPSSFLVVLIPFVIGISSPIICWFEEDFVNQDIFEIGYQIIFTKRVEALIKELNVTTDVFWTEEFAEAVCKLEQSDESDKAWDEFCNEVKRIQAVLNETKR